MAQLRKQKPSRAMRSDIAMVRSYGGRRVERLKKPDVDLDLDQVADLRDLATGPVCWPVG